MSSINIAINSTEPPSSEKYEYIHQIASTACISVCVYMDSWNHRLIIVSYMKGFAKCHALLPKHENKTNEMCEKCSQICMHLQGNQYEYRSAKCSPTIFGVIIQSSWVNRCKEIVANQVFLYVRPEESPLSSDDLMASLDKREKDLISACFFLC